MARSKTNLEEVEAAYKQAAAAYSAVLNVPENWGTALLRDATNNYIAAAAAVDVALLKAGTPLAFGRTYAPRPVNW